MTYIIVNLENGRMTPAQAFTEEDAIREMKRFGEDLLVAERFKGRATLRLVDGANRDVIREAWVFRNPRGFDFWMTDRDGKFIN